LESATPIQPILLGDNARALAVSARLADSGFLVPAIRPPSVPAGQARLRITLSALHEDTQIDRLLEGLDAALRSSKVTSDVSGHG